MMVFHSISELGSCAARRLLFISPSGLITVLLFLSIPLERNLPMFSQSLVIQVVLISSLMMVGTDFGKTQEIEDIEKPKHLKESAQVGEVDEG
jgi:potassium/hydrogen antiporter